MMHFTHHHVDEVGDTLDSRLQLVHPCYELSESSIVDHLLLPGDALPVRRIPT